MVYTEEKKAKHSKNKLPPKHSRVIRSQLTFKTWFFRKLSSSSAVALKSCFATASMACCCYCCFCRWLFCWGVCVCGPRRRSDARQDTRGGGSHVGNAGRAGNPFSPNNWPQNRGPGGKHPHQYTHAQTRSVAHNYTYTSAMVCDRSHSFPKSHG